MSAFLGPIHFWLYNKIKIQNNIVEDILDLSENIGLNFRKDLYEQYGDGDLKPLDEVIDVGNIHGWLQNQISMVEYKLAYVVTEILNKNPDSIEEIKTIFKHNGAKYSTLNNASTMEEAFKAINDTMLDGMPCDHVNAVVNQDEKEAVWKRYECVHSKYWDAAKGDVSIYYALRDEFIEGLLSIANINYEKLNDTTYKISRG
ncbi:MAG: hypothetical protein AB7V48_01425 [Sedimentibacter sp.]